MSDIKWFKVLTDIFSDDKIKIIQSMPEGDALIVMWFKILAQAGKTNDGGYIYLKRTIPYNAGMLSTLFNKPQQLVELALRTFTEFGMIDIDDRGYIFLTNWEKHQNIVGMDKVKEQTRKRVADHRERKRMELQSLTLKCAYCGSEGNTLDHIVPRSKGGTDEPENCVPACKSCNSSKKDKDLADFLNDSVFYTYQNVNFELVLKNEKLMRYVDYIDEKFQMKRYGNVTVTHGNATEVELDKEKDTTLQEDDFQKVRIAYRELHKTMDLPYQDSLILTRLLEDGFTPEHIIGIMNDRYKPTVKTLRYYEGAIRDSVSTGSYRSRGKGQAAHHQKPDKELEARRREIAFNQWMQNGGNPDEFEYGPA